MKANFATGLNKKFGTVFRAVSEKADFDFPVLLKVKEVREDGTVIAAMFPNDGKDFYMEITDVREYKDEWLVTTPTERWSFRPLQAKQQKDFTEYMRSVGFKV